MDPSAGFFRLHNPINKYKQHCLYHNRLLHRAATRIQSLWRGHHLRLRLAHVLWRRTSAYKIQLCWRKYKQHQSSRFVPATKIQSFLRGCMLRHRLACILDEFSGYDGAKQEL